MPSSSPLWIAVPVKPLAQGKSRLAPLLPPNERQALARRLLERTLDVVGRIEEAAGVLVISRDREVLALAQDARATPLVEEANGNGNGNGREAGLNRAVAQAAAWTRQRGAEALLVLPADLPLLEPDDIRLLMRAWGGDDRSVVLAPSRTGGTNGLLLAPPDGIAPAFGPESFSRHRELAQSAGLTCTVAESPGLAWDVDTPEEFARLVEWGAVQRASGPQALR